MAAIGLVAIRQLGSAINSADCAVRRVNVNKKRALVVWIGTNYIFNLVHPLSMVLAESRSATATVSFGNREQVRT